MIQEELKNGVMTLSLNRPEKLNALTLEMMDTLLKNLTRAEEDSEVRCIILRGNGEFSLGFLDSNRSCGKGWG